MNPTLLAEAAIVTDVQAQPDLRGVRIDRVGIRRLRYPIVVDTRSGRQTSVAEWELTVALEAERRGTHMSRFVEALEAQRTTSLTGRRVIALVSDIATRLDAPAAQARCAFPVFIDRAAPVSGLRAQHAVDCSYHATVSPGETALRLGVRVPVTTLCPCSKEISEYGAHNQRGYVDLTDDAAPHADLDFGDLIEVAERAGSAGVYPLLKRADERHVTMQAYDAPAFVEDVVRNAALDLAADPRISRFTVEAENHESIHDHSALAAITWERP
jgi:GTP cyclohydrolase I